ncbi:unnamed protein product [Linum trigynum]|uniref:Uncharacterized protein n=1 Tax=Linum trigynum TaxID=586398 RepID=A0AAV2DH16_9ROSI
MEPRVNHVVAGEGRMGSPKRELLRSMKGGRNHKNSSRSNHQQLLESIARANSGGGPAVVCQEGGGGGPGVVRMKVLVRKQDLKQMLELLGDGGQKQASKLSPSSSPLPRLSSASNVSNVEQRLNLLRRKQAMRGNGGKGCKASSPRSWIPALHSIPEEL